MNIYQVAQMAVAICKDEVEGVLGPITWSDGGSPWGRAMLKVISEIRDAELRDVLTDSKEKENENINISQSNLSTDRYDCSKPNEPKST